MISNQLRNFFIRATLLVAVGSSSLVTEHSASKLNKAFASEVSAPEVKIGLALVDLPDSDGVGLLPKPLKELKEGSTSSRDPSACSTNCITPYGKLLGSVDGTDSFSNCKSTCVKPEFSFLNLNTGEVTVHAEKPKKEDLRYIGVTYQW